MGLPLKTVRADHFDSQPGAKNDSGVRGGEAQVDSNHQMLCSTQTVGDIGWCLSVVSMLAKQPCA